jgi:hypothetical protein
MKFYEICVGNLLIFGLVQLVWSMVLEIICLALEESLQNYGYFLLATTKSFEDLLF